MEVARGLPGAWPITCKSSLSGNCGPVADGRFTDILIDVSNTYGRKPINDVAIEFVRPGQLHLIGGSIGSRVLVGNNTDVFDVGVRWQNGGHIATAENTSGAKIFGLQEKNETQMLRDEVAQLRKDVQMLRAMVLG